MDTHVVQGSLPSFEQEIRRQDVMWEELREAMSETDASVRFLLSEEWLSGWEQMGAQHAQPMGENTGFSYRA